VVYKAKLSNLRLVKRRKREDPFLSVKNRFKRYLKAYYKKRR